MSGAWLNWRLFYTLLVISWTATRSNGQTTNGNQILPITDTPPCSPLSDTASFCTNTGYYASAITYLPNARNHETPLQAITELNDFLSLVNTGCSNAVSFFLCAYYVPACFQSGGNFILLKPCRNLCEYVQSRCEPEFISNNIAWPLQFNCSLGDFAEQPQCFGPPDPSQLDGLGITTPAITMNTDTTTDFMFTTNGGSVVTVGGRLFVALAAVITVINIIKFMN